MLDTQHATDRAQAAVERARRAGSDAADAVFVADASSTVQVRDGALEDVGRSESAELGLRVFVGARSASVSTSDLSDDALDTLVERAVAMARLAPEDPWGALPRPSACCVAWRPISTWTIAPTRRPRR